MAEGKRVAFTSGKPNVKAGNEKELADWTLAHQSGSIKARLLQEADDALRSMSVGSWKDPDSIADWRRAESFEKNMVKLKDPCDEIQVCTLKSVVHVKAR